MERISLLSGFAISAVAIFLAFNDKNTMADDFGGEMRNDIELDSVLRNSRSVCVGRAMLSVPSSALIIFGPAHVGYPISRLRGKAKNFNEFVKKTLDEVSVRKKYADGRLLDQDSLVGRVMDGVNENHKLVFGIGRGSASFYLISSIIVVGDDIYVQEAEIFPEKEEYLRVVQNLSDVARNIVFNTDDHQPEESGLCIDGAIVQDNRKPGYEWTTIGVRLREFPDIHFSLSLTKKDRLVDSDSLESRLSAAESKARTTDAERWFSRIRVLRKGPRNLGMWKGFEVAVWKPAQKTEGESHDFSYVSQGEPNNPLLPLVEAKMDTGLRENRKGSVHPSVTDEKALEIWDNFLNSVRIREVRGAR